MVAFSFITVASLLALVDAVVAAQPQVAGVGRLNTASGGVQQQQVQFSDDSLSSSVQAIVNSIGQGPNRTVAASLPVSKVYGVNYGAWLLFEPWMSPSSWEAMGGDICDDCSTCRGSEWSLAKFLGQSKTNSAFQQHWRSWLTQSDVDQIKAAGLNTVRLPLGFWIVEDIVDRPNEPYAQGGLDELIRGLTMFRDAGINVLLDHHALPGVSSSKQMFAGNCTDQVHFYSSPNDHNYKRAVTWSIVMAFLSHTHPAFSTVFGIEAVNEPLQDASQTPGLGRFEKSFVLGIRAVEFSLGIICDTTFLPGALTDSIALPAFADAVPIIGKLALKYGLGSPLGLLNLDALLGSEGVLSAAGLERLLGGVLRQRQCLSTTFMNRDWQHSNPSNPSDAAHGPQVYDNHLYLNFGGVAPENTPESYLQTICTTNRITQAIGVGNTPLVTGEWSLATAFDATDSFLKQYGDAQKLTYSQGAGWIFWNWKVDDDVQWSYQAALKTGLFTSKPDQFFDKNVCAQFN